MSAVTGPVPVRPEPERDRYGRYVIPDPRTGRRRSWTRATTYAKTVADSAALERWKIRMTALGLAQRQDLYVGVAAIADPDADNGKKKLDALCEAAKEHAGSSRGATIGTALHSFSQQIDIGQTPRVPAPFDRDLEAYRLTLTEAGVEVSPNWVERIVVVPHLGVAGTMDRLVRWQGRLMIGDLKTASTLDYSWGEIAIQLAIYAHAETMFDVDLNRHFPMAQVDKHQALVMHLPAGKGHCELYMVDIDAGWRMALICRTVRDWRKRRDLARPLDAALALEASA